MKPEPRFNNLDNDFWAHVRIISQEVGYTVRGQGIIKIPSLSQILKAFKKLNLNSHHLSNDGVNPSECTKNLLDYFEYRARVLNSYVEPRLMDAKRAKQVFDDLYNKHKPKCPTPYNKQKGSKKRPAYFTGIINILIEANANGLPCDYDPRALTTITKNNIPLRTLARRIDGAFPRVVDPISVWEVKEYYYTTTFGSRVADGVYESLLDGMELEELRKNENIDVKHYLMVDAHYTWWDCGRSYLCRIIDMLHMGYLDEVLFGYEVVEQMPRIVKEWILIAKAR